MGRERESTGYTDVSRALSSDSVVKNPPAIAGDAGDAGSVPGLGQSPGGGRGNPLQYSCLEDPHGQNSLAGYSPWGSKELDRTEQLSTAYILQVLQIQFVQS